MLSEENNEDVQLEEITAKATGKIYKKREIILIDKSNESVTVTMWNNDAENFAECKLRSVVTLNNGGLNEYDGKISISMTRDTSINFDVDNLDNKMLKEWFEGKKMFFY